MDDIKKEYTKVALSSTNEYPTYQAIYELHPQNGLDTSGLFRKSVLIVADWIRGRVAQNGGDTSFLSMYPDPSEYGTFQVEGAPDITPHSGFDVASQYSKKEKSWALRVIEVNTEKDYYQSFKTDIAIRELESLVLLAIRITCRETEREELADVWRTSFVTQVLMKDEDIIVTEKACPIDFPIKLGAISLNGKSKQVCEMFNTDFIANEGRLFPIVIMPETILSRIDQHELLKKMVYKIKGISYITVLEESVNKLFISVMNKPELAKELEKGDKCLVITDPKAEDGFKTHVLFNGTEDQDGNEIIDEPVLDDVCKHVQNYLRKKDVNYGDLLFLSELRQVVLLENLPTAASEAEKQEIALVFEKALEEKDEDLRRMSEEVAKRDKKIKDLEKNLQAAHHENKSDKLAMELDDKEAEIKRLKDEIIEKDDQIAGLREESLRAIERYKPLFDLPLPQASIESIIAWVERNYGDRVILHDRAKKMFISNGSGRDLAFICRMFHYIYGYTCLVGQHAGDPTGLQESLKAYDVLDEHLEVTDVGRNPIMHHPESYEIDISMYNPSAGKVVMDKHVKDGKGMDSDSIRIYLYYDSEMEKTIVGTMLEHLDIGMK